MTITPEMKRIAEEHPLGLVGTVNPDGTPNVSPKGTTAVLDEGTIVFGEIRSPVTLRNISERPAMEINFVDVLSRRCFRAKGIAEAIPRGTDEFEALFSHFERWGELASRIRHIVRLRVSRALIVTSPAYDVGETEESLKARYRSHYAELD